MNPLAKIHRDLIQGSEAWFAARRGRATASRASDIITAAKGDYSKSARKYALELIAELMAPNEPPPFAGSFATDRGSEYEPQAIAAFSAMTGLRTEKIGFIEILTPGCPIGQVGLSPDALITDATGHDYCAGLEAKCPLRTKHVQNAADVAAGNLPEDYKQQLHWSLALTGLPEWHFFSWHPEMAPAHLIVRPDAFTDRVVECLANFVREYAELREFLIPKLQITTP